MTNEVELIPLDAVDIDTAEKQEFNAGKKRMIFDNMKRFGITALRVHFSGGGDSGQIDEINYNGLHQNSVELEKMAITEEYEIQNGTVYEGGVQKPHMEKKTPANMHDLVEDLTYEILQACQYDWCNNDGGQGSVYIFTGPEDGEHITVDMDINTMSQENFPIVVLSNG
jgi:hypothetical protein